MIFVAALLMAAAPPPPLSRDVFMDEAAAARAFEQQMNCVAGEMYGRRDDDRAAKDLAPDIVKACSQNASALRKALTDVYRRRPMLLPPGENAEQAAASYVNEMNSRVELVVQEGRAHK
jgi:hypothetical protein